jgi:hypothetical protein
LTSTSTRNFWIRAAWLRLCGYSWLLNSWCRWTAGPRNHINWFSKSLRWADELAKSFVATFFTLLNELDQMPWPSDVIALHEVRFEQSKSSHFCATPRAGVA